MKGYFNKYKWVIIWLVLLLGAFVAAMPAANGGG
jgi:hypothetical protein